MSGSIASASRERPRDLGEFVTWIEHMNADMLAAGVELGDRFDFDLVHGHDWLVAAPATTWRGASAARRGDDPRDRVRPPPGLGGQAPAVLHPRRRALDGQPRRPRHHVLALHARPRRRHLRPRGGPGQGDPQRDRPVDLQPVDDLEHAPRPLRRAGRAAGPAGRPAGLREGLPARARGAAGPDRAPGQRALPRRRLGHARGGAARPGDRAGPRPSTARSWAGSATTSCTRSTGSPTSA